MPIQNKDHKLDTKTLRRHRRVIRRLREEVRVHDRFFSAMGVAMGAFLVLLIVFSLQQRRGPGILIGMGQASVMEMPRFRTVAYRADSLGSAVRRADSLKAANAAPGKALGSGTASYYGAELQGRRTASGERFNPAEFTAAHRSLPLGSRIRVTNLKNGKSVVVRVNDRGPFSRNRVIDLSRAAAREIEMIRAGTARVKLELLPRVRS